MVAKIQLDNRKQLQVIREGAEQFASEVASKIWRRAYLRLADAADCLDAMEARTEDKEDKED